MSSRGLLALSLLALIAGSRPARAANEAHPRTPVIWPSECGRVVERGTNPIVHLDYAIPLEDTVLGPDELPDSRTHQFVGLCRQHPYSELLPIWVTRDDLERSVDAGLVAANTVSEREILDESSVWTDCQTRITPDDARHRIDFETAAAGVDWDTTGLEVGVWSVSAYTFEPSFNLWSDRLGFVKVVDQRDDPDQDLPALGLLNREQAVLEVGATIELEACVDFLGPGRLELEWARFAPFLDWQPLETFEVSEDGALDLAVRAPSQSADQEILVRGRLIDARDREYVAHAPARLTIAACSPQGCPEPPEDDDAKDLTAGGCALVADPGQLGPGSLFLALLMLGVCSGLVQRGKLRRQNVGSGGLAHLFSIFP